MFGLHWALVPVAMVAINSGQPDTILAAMFATTFAQTGACIGIWIKTKDKKIKGLAPAAIISGVCGVTEPAIYGVLLARKKLFAAMCLINGIGGALCAVMHVTRDVQMSVNLFTLPAIYAVYGVWGIVAIAISIVGAFILGLVVISSEKKVKGKLA